MALPLSELFGKIGGLPGSVLAALGAAAGGVGLGIGLKLAKKFLPGIIGKAVRGLVLKGMSADKPHVRNLVKACVLYVEAEIPDKGTGVEKWRRVVAMLGIQAHEKELLDIIEEVVGNVDDELKKLGA